MILNFLDENYEIKADYICESFAEAKRVIKFANKILKHRHLEFKADSFHSEKDIRRWFELRKLEMQNKATAQK